MPKQVVHSNGFIEFVPTDEEVRLTSLDDRLRKIEESQSIIINYLSNISRLLEISLGNESITSKKEEIHEN